MGASVSPWPQAGCGAWAFHKWSKHLPPDVEAGRAQRLTLVHFSAQLEPCLRDKNTIHYAHPLSHKKRSR